MGELAQFAPNSSPPLAASLTLSIVLFITVVNSPLRREAVRKARTSLTMTWIGVIVIAWFSGPVLDKLNISAPNWRIATGMLLVAAALVDLFGRRVEPVLFRPELGALALQTGRDHGVGAAALAGAIGLATLVLWRHNSKALGRAVALVQIALAVALLLDGVFAL
jgi:small neutral amino acid transporter SnatA (MarC family)